VPGRGGEWCGGEADGILGRVSNRCCCGSGWGCADCRAFSAGGESENGEAGDGRVGCGVTCVVAVVVLGPAMGGSAVTLPVSMVATTGGFLPSATSPAAILFADSLQ